MQGWFIIICGGLRSDRGDPLVWSFPSVYACLSVCLCVCVPTRRTFAAAGPTVTMRDSSPHTHTHTCTHTQGLQYTCGIIVPSLLLSFFFSTICHFAVFVDTHTHTQIRLVSCVDLQGQNYKLDFKRKKSTAVLTKSLLNEIITIKNFWCA